MSDSFTAHGVEQRSTMPVVVRTGIDNRDAPASEDVTHGPFECERAGVVGHNPPDTGCCLLNLARLEIETLVESNVVGHVAVRMFFCTFF